MINGRLRLSLGNCFRRLAGPSRRATILGTRSFGKRPRFRRSCYHWAPATARFRLTTAKRVHTPSGRSIQAEGITPDITVLQNVPKELQGSAADRSPVRASLPGHFHAQGKEERARRRPPPRSRKMIPPCKQRWRCCAAARSMLPSRRSASRRWRGKRINRRISNVQGGQRLARAPCPRCLVQKRSVRPREGLPALKDSVSQLRRFCPLFLRACATPREN